MRPVLDSVIKITLGIVVGAGFFLRFQSCYPKNTLVQRTSNFFSSTRYYGMIFYFDQAAYDLCKEKLPRDKDYAILILSGDDCHIQFSMNMDGEVGGCGSHCK